MKVIYGFIKLWGMLRIIGVILPYKKKIFKNEKCYLGVYELQMSLAVKQRHKFATGMLKKRP